MARAQYPGVYRTGSETWCYKLRLPLDAATGKRPWEVRGAFTTARAAHDARTRRQAQLLDGVQTRRDGRTVADAVADWIGGRRRARVSSRHRWETTARLYITPDRGDVRRDRLDDRTIDRWISSLERAPNSRTKQAGLSAGTIGQARALRRIGAGVTHGHACPRACAPTRHRQAGTTQSQDQHRGAVSYTHLTLPTSDLV